MMSLNAKHHRRSIRLQDYDYTQNGAYFVTICTHQRANLFGEVVDDAMVVNDMGEIVQTEWERTLVLRPYVELDAFVVMPNHIHGIIVITDDGGSGMAGRGMMHHPPTHTTPTQRTPINDKPREFSQPVARSLPTIVGTFKVAVTRQINRLPDPPDHPIWQRNYYEHIIRNEDKLHSIRAYVENNPATWQANSLYVSTISNDE